MQDKPERGEERMRGEMWCCAPWLWRNCPPRRTTGAARNIRFWFPGKALTSDGYTVLPHTNTVTGACVSAGMCVCVCVCVVPHILFSRRWSHFVIDGVGAWSPGHTDYRRCLCPPLLHPAARYDGELFFTPGDPINLSYQWSLSISMLIFVFISACRFSICA